MAKSYGVYISNDGTAITCPTTTLSWTDTKIITESSRNPDGTPCAQVAAIAVVPCAAVEKVLTIGEPNTGTISGKVTDSKGTALAGASIATNTGGYTTSTAVDGTYSLTVKPGPYAVTASQTGLYSLSATVAVMAGATATLDFALTVTPPTATRFTESYCRACHDNPSQFPGIMPQLTDVVRHHQYNDPPLSYACNVCHPVYIDNNGIVQGLMDRNCLDCHTPRTISSATLSNGRITLDGSRFAALAKSYGVSIDKNDGTGSTCPTTTLSWTDTRIIAESSRNPDGTPCAQVNTIAAVPCAAVEKMFAGTPPIGTISGKVTDSTGTALAGATIATNTGGYTATTTTNGIYSLTVAPGTYVVTASQTGFNSLSATVTVTTGAMVALDFTLTPIPTTGMISGKVTDSRGTAIAGATIATNTGGYTAITAADGTYSMANVNAGTYTVTASKSGYNSGSATVTVTAGATTTQNFTLTAIPTGTIRGKVTDSQGTAITGATISTKTGGYTTITAADGTYSLTVNAGTYTVTASKAGYNTKSATVTVAVDRTKTLNFTLSRSRH